MESNQGYSIDNVTEELGNVLRLRLAARERSRDLPPQVEPTLLQRNRHRRLRSDWSSSLDAVQQASDTLNAAATRAREINARGLALAERSLQELHTAEAQIQSIEEASRAAEARATEAELRAHEAEEWLRRLHKAINEGLLVRRTDAPAFRG